MTEGRVMVSKRTIQRRIAKGMTREQAETMPNMRQWYNKITCWNSQHLGLAVVVLRQF